MESCDDKPLPPSPSDCCGSGCRMCILDVYDDELAAWERRQEQDLAKTFVEPVMKMSSYREFMLLDVTIVSETANMYRFHLDSGQCLNFTVGQHVILKQSSCGKVVTREYTPVSSPSAKGYFDVLIKLYCGGKMSELIREWKVGDMVPWRGPCGGLTYTRNQYSHMVLFAAGTGVTPFYQLIHHVLADEEDDTRLTLLYASKCFSEVYFRDELSECCSHWNFTLTHFLSEERDVSKRKYGEKVCFGRITGRDIKAEIDNISIDSSIFISCGTESFNCDMKTNLISHGVSPQHICQL